MDRQEIEIAEDTIAALHEEIADLEAELRAAYRHIDELKREIRILEARGQ